MNHRVKTQVPISILMQVCNEAEVIESVIEECVGDVFEFLPEGSEILFGDGASTDGTQELLIKFVVNIHLSVLSIIRKYMGLLRRQGGSIGRQSVHSYFLLVPMVSM